MKCTEALSTLHRWQVGQTTRFRTSDFGKESLKHQSVIFNFYVIFTDRSS